MNTKEQPPWFSWNALLGGAMLNGLGCIALGGLRFLDGMGQFGFKPPSQPTLVQILCWIWSPLPMAIEAKTEWERMSDWPIWYVVLSASSFGLFMGFFIPWWKQPLER